MFLSRSSAFKIPDMMATDARRAVERIDASRADRLQARRAADKENKSPRLGQLGLKRRGVGVKPGKSCHEGSGHARKRVEPAASEETVAAGVPEAHAALPSTFHLPVNTFLGPPHARSTETIISPTMHDVAARHAQYVSHVRKRRQQSVLITPPIGGELAELMCSLNLAEGVSSS